MRRFFFLHPKDDGIVLIRIAELRQRLELEWGDAVDALALRVVVGLLAGQGIVQKLDFGDWVLLQPEQINNYASAVVRAARESSSELAEVPERDVLDAKIDFKDLPRLQEADEAILLRAMLQTFLDRSLCARVDTVEGAKLVSPAYFRQDRPEIAQHPNVVVTYGFLGTVDEIYTTLVVRLHYTNEFVIERLWRYAADFKPFCGGRAGLLLTKSEDDAAELKAYFDAGVAEDTKVLFIKYIHEHLRRQAQNVTRVRSYVCPHCKTPLESKTAIAKRLEIRKADIVCGVCEKRVLLVDLIEDKFASDDFLMGVRKMDDEAQIRLDEESLELILVGHAYSTVGEAGHIFRQVSNSAWGIDGEIEFNNDNGEPSGLRLYLQLKSGDSYLHQGTSDGNEILEIRNARHAEYWQAHEYPVMLVIRSSDGEIHWMNVTDHLKKHGSATKQIVFEGEPFTAINVASKAPGFRLAP